MPPVMPPTSYVVLDQLFNFCVPLFPYYNGLLWELNQLMCIQYLEQFQACHKHSLRHSGFKHCSCLGLILFQCICHSLKILCSVPPAPSFPICYTPPTKSIFFIPVDSFVYLCILLMDTYRISYSSTFVQVGTAQPSTPFQMALQELPPQYSLSHNHQHQTELIGQQVSQRVPCLECGTCSPIRRWQNFSPEAKSLKCKTAVVAKFSAMQKYLINPVSFSLWTSQKL